MGKKRQDKLKIALLGHKTMPARDASRGGVEVVVEELSTRLAAGGQGVTCYNRRGCDNGGLKAYQGVALKKVFTIDRKGLAALTSSFFAALRAAFGPYDVVHIHAEGPAAMTWLPRLFGKRCIVTVHGLDWQREKWKSGFGSRYIRFGEKMAVRYAHEIIVLSRAVQDYFLETYNRKTVFIPNGVSRPVPMPAELITEKFGLKKNGYVLFLGRIVPEKGLRYLVEAYKGLDSDKKLVIAGGSSDTDAFYREIREQAKSLQDRVVFTGFVGGRLREELYSNAYVYVLPSDLEGMPLSLLEAMSYGNCCLVSDIAECTEVIGSHGVAFRKGHTADLREKLQMLCHKPEQVEAYQREAADFICGKFNWDEVAARTLTLYRGSLHENLNN